MPPGLVMVWSAGEPALRVVHTPVVEAMSDALVIGREHTPADDHVSANHVRVYPRERDFVIGGERSPNGVFANGHRVGLQTTVLDGAIIRTGRTLWVALLDVSPFEAPREAEPFAIDVLPTLVRRTVRERAPDLPIHATAIEACLLARWESPEQVVEKVRAAVDACAAAGKTKLRGEDLGGLVQQARLIEFAEVFERDMHAPPPFEIVRPYEVLSKRTLGDGSVAELMIGSGIGTSLLVQADIGTVRAQPVGWFQAGFWGHGVNSYSVYYGRATERYRIYLRLPYGAGAYCRDPDRERAWAMETLAKYIALVETLPVRHALLVQSVSYGEYELVRNDGSVVQGADLLGLDQVDLVSLAHGA